MGSRDNVYEAFGTPKYITLANGDIVGPGDRVYHERHGSGTIVSFGASGSSIYNLDVKFDNWEEPRIPKIKGPGYDVSLWGSQDPLISKIRCLEVY
jgi:hypothetical protein